MKNLILVLSNKILVLFDKSIRISLARARMHAYIKFFTFATVATLQHYLIISTLRVATR